MNLSATSREEAPLANMYKNIPTCSLNICHLVINLCQPSIELVVETYLGQVLVALYTL